MMRTTADARSGVVITIATSVVSKEKKAVAHCSLGMNVHSADEQISAYL
jgi:hypothetical protein